jgi:hypothetical protein
MAQHAATAPRTRPIGVTILSVLTGIAAVLCGVHLLQSLGIFPYVIGPFTIRDFNLWYALMWGLLVWVYIWLLQMLWRVDRAAWLFLIIITIWNLSVDFITILGSATFSDVSLSFLVNGAILIYCMLPGVREAFDTD